MEENEKKGGFLKGLSNIFFEESSSDPSSTESVQSTESPAGGTSVSVSAPVYSESVAIPTGNGVFDQKFNDMFQKLIEENNIPGVDYFEFKQALINLVNVPGLSEAVALQMAYTTLKVGDPSLTKEKLTSSIDHYDKVLVEEEGNFNKALQNQTNKEVALKKEKAEKLNIENVELVKKIQELNEKIAENQKQSIQLNTESAQAEARISQTAKNFSTTLSSVRAKLAEDKQKITTTVQ